MLGESGRLLCIPFLTSKFVPMLEHLSPAGKWPNDDLKAILL